MPTDLVIFPLHGCDPLFSIRLCPARLGFRVFDRDLKRLPSNLREGP